MPPLSILITSRQIELAKQVAVDLQHAIGLTESQTSLYSYFDAATRVDQIRLLESHIGQDLRRLRILEIGSGMGLFVTVARKAGIDCIGIEPSANSYARLQSGIEEMLTANNLPAASIVNAPAEQLPWNNESFDAVVSFQVLEHMANPEQALREACRVLKPGGWMFLDCPNHFSFFEGHFGIVWCPLLAFSRSLSLRYVKIWGRKPDFLDELNLITPRRIRRWTRRLNMPFAITPPRMGPHPVRYHADLSASLHFPDGFTLTKGRRSGRFTSIVRNLLTQRLVITVLGALGMTDHLMAIGQKPGNAA